MKRFKFLLLISMVIMAAGIALAADLSIESDKQTFKMEENKAKFEGNVKVKMDESYLTKSRSIY